VRPTNALQVVTLDVAQLLLYTRRHDHRSVAQVGFAVLPAFQTFKPDLYTRLLSFFDEGVLAWMLHSLDQLTSTIAPPPQVSGWLYVHQRGILSNITNYIRS
jgi:hypothetical protein